MTIRRICGIDGEGIGTYYDCTFKEAAFRAVELYCQWKHKEIRVDRSLSPGCVKVKVYDPDTENSFEMKIEVRLSLVWINPREGTDY